jgi:hypothetical protein
MSPVQVGTAAAIMLAWGLPLTALTLRVLCVTNEIHRLVAGSLLAAGYGLLAVPLLHWLVF